MQDLESKLIQEEADLRIQQLIDAKVAEVMNSDVVQHTLQQRLEDERKSMEQQVGDLETSSLNDHVTQDV